MFSGLTTTRVERQLKILEERTGEEAGEKLATHFHREGCNDSGHSGQPIEEAVVPEFSGV
jgi:hypothetical protein